ncbi:MAG: bifunctional folylpolyglutamate synthase/dihydrofolate synthase [Thermoleophilia bacterium]|nr:bifunctional folylpolyglutamate synthase/dihydrofolate synthase [Thermoleophilia bacterium]
MTPEAAEQWIAELDLMGMRFGLDRVSALMQALGQPCRSVPSIHVVGTNGKTSVTRMAAAFLTASGLRTGAYVSPHVTGWRERVALDGHDITPQAFAVAATRVRRAVPSIPEGAITQFEALTVLALDALAAAGADAVVVEAGLGGRLDATNVIGASVVALTGVDLDHVDLLGDTVELIAAEKLGVAPDAFDGLVVGRLDDRTGPGVRAAISARGMSGWRVGQEIEVSPGNRFPMTIRTPNGTVEVHAEVLGAWQRDNMAVAVAAAERMLGHGLDPDVVEEGIARVANPGRLQVIPGSPVIVLDGAHNPAGARALAEALPEILGDVRPVAVIGMMADKDAAGICDALAPVIHSAHVTRASTGRAMRPEPIARLFTGRGVPADVVPGPTRAFERACAEAGPDGAVLVAGSLHLLSDLQPIVGARVHGGTGGTLAAARGQSVHAATVWGAR